MLALCRIFHACISRNAKKRINFLITAVVVFTKMWELCNKKSFLTGLMMPIFSMFENYKTLAAPLLKFNILLSLIGIRKQRMSEANNVASESASK